MARYDLGQGARALILVGDVLILLVMSYLAFGKLVPPFDSKGFWFYTALLGLVLGNRLVTPFYTKPADAIAYSVPAAVGLVLVAGAVDWDRTSLYLYILALGYALLLFLVAFMAIVMKDAVSTRIKSISAALSTVADKFGKPELVFGVILLFSFYAFHRDSAVEIFWLLAGWLTVVSIRPIELVLNIVGRVRASFFFPDVGPAIGQIVAFQSPNIVTVREADQAHIGFGTLVAVRDPNGQPFIAISAGYVGRDNGRIVRLIADAVTDQVPSKILRVLNKYEAGSVVALPASWVDELGPGSKAYRLVEKRDQLIGIVAPDSDVRTLHFEVIGGADIAEGMLVEVDIGGKEVLYQITNGLTKEELVYQRNTYGYVRASAQKIGLWDGHGRRFVLVPWVPEINTPVFIRVPERPRFDVDAVGFFPGTSFSVGLKDTSALVTHNTAILGILGVGKSMLAIELIERLMSSGVKIICLDLTDQYALELAPYYDREFEEQAIDKIRAACDRDRDAWQENPEAGGSRPNLIEAIREDLEFFLDPVNPRLLKIYNPAKIVATKQVQEPRSFNVGGQWHRQAAIWTMSPVEVTQIVTETALSICQPEMVDHARVCLVYEEAHSLVPEWNAVASEGDRVASNATARAILQGRKYGLGCVVVTQRTANVTKTILNQCNNVFAMRTFDETGKDFLANYIGKEYSRVLSSIPPRHAVFFGNASSSENPVLIELNNRQDFIDRFRVENPPPLLPAHHGEEAAAEPQVEVDEFEDDLPF